MLLNVIKIGGEVIDKTDLLNQFLNDFSKLEGKKILIHGGGKKATEISRLLGIETKLVDGRRITDEKSLEVAVMVYGGLINKKIISKLQSLSCNAIGLTGADGNTILADKRPVKEIDYGWVGDIKKVNTEQIDSLLSNNITPVFAALTHDGQGNMLNTNADTIASAIATAMAGKHNVRLIYCFDKQGVLEDINDENSLIKKINAAQYEELKNKKIISVGMIPKLDTGFSALKKGVKEVRITHCNDISNNSKNGTSLVL